MADREIIAATLAAGLIHARTIHATARDQTVIGGRTAAMAFAGAGPDEKEAVRLYHAVLAELAARTHAGAPPPAASSP